MYQPLSLATMNFKKEIEGNKNLIAIVQSFNIIFLRDELGFWVLGINELAFETLSSTPRE